MTYRVRQSKNSCGTDAPVGKHSRVFEAIENGERIGCLRIDDTGEGVTPFWSWVAPAHRRRGVGTKLYEAAARGSCRAFKQPLSSSDDLSVESRGFWEKQRRKGRAECLFEEDGLCRHYQLTCPAPASLAAPPHLEPKLQEKEREIVKLKSERGVLYDEDGRIVLEKKGTKTRLKFDEDDVALFPNRYLTHNHPPTKFGEFDAGNSLSVADVYVAAKRNLAEVRAVTKLPIGGQQRTVLYRLERPPGGWPAPWKIKDEAESTSNRVMWQLSADLAAKRRTHEEVVAAVMHETWIELAPKFGFKYDRLVLEGAELGRAAGRRRRRRVHSR